MEIESTTKNIIMKSPGAGGFTGEFYQKKKKLYQFFSVSSKNWKGGNWKEIGEFGSPNSFNEVSIILIPKPETQEKKTIGQ